MPTVPQSVPEPGRPPRGSRRGRLRGSVLVIVLVTLLFTAFALVLLVEQASTDLLVEARDLAARRLRREAYSALDATLATLEDFRLVVGNLHSPAEGWDDPLGFSGWSPRAGCTAEVELVDESGKISLSHVDGATLVNLCKSWDLKQAEAERLADALLGWMRPDYVPMGSRSPDYEQGLLPFLPPVRPLRSFTELAAIDYAREVFYDEEGRPNDRWRRFAATFSLFDYPTLNLNAAPPDVLTALGLSDVSQQQRFREYLTGTGIYAHAGPAWLSSAPQAAQVLGTAALPPGTGTQVQALRINVTVREGRTEFRLTAVVASAGGAKVVSTTALSPHLVAPKTAAPAPPAPAVAPAAELNYPFTLLEIRENPVMSAPPPAAPSA